MGAALAFVSVVELSARCHTYGIRRPYDKRMNPKKFRGYCNAGCGNTIKKGATRFCSFRCQQELGFRLRSKLLESGEYFAMQTTSFLRKYLIRLLGERCSRCGWAERHPKRIRFPIEVEHIDGDWRNQRVENLTLLCPNCHSLTPTFRGLNRGRGRAHRLRYWPETQA